MKKTKLTIKSKTIIYNLIWDTKNFSFCVAFFHALWFMFEDRKKTSKLHRWCYLKREKSVHEYLKKYFEKIIIKYRSYNSDKITENVEKFKQPIWVLWWQGIESAPDFILKCIKSKKKAANGHPVIVLTKENYQEYIELPSHIKNKLNEGKLSLQHLADIIRVNLIKEYGGIWLDASIYCVDQIPEDIYEYEVFSCKGVKSGSDNISKGRWTTYVIGGKKDNILCSFLSECFFEYCRKKDKFIDYFMFDHLINIAYETIPAVQKALDCLPFNNEMCEYLSEIINDSYSDLEYSKIVNGTTYLYKLPWKKDFQVRTNEGSETFYYYFFKKEDME